MDEHMDRYLEALVMKDGAPEEVTIAEISGMGEVFFDEIEADARNSAYECVEEWPDEADFARVRLYDFDRFEGQPSPIEGLPRWEIPPHYEMERRLLEFIAVEPDDQGRPEERIIEPDNPLETYCG